MQKGLLILAFAVCLSVALADIHAVLIAGSNGFYNYRHQADVCHAYNTLVRKGVNPENIIVLSYDDVANDPTNPLPGQLYNKPNGEEHYKSCKIDYKGEDVTADNFLAVLTGDNTTTKGKKVLRSTEKDHVFINFVDHGAVGLVAVIDDYLYADQLVSALKTMHTKKMYERLVFYMEACESGSMFENLPKDIEIYAVTASNADESSWGCYCSAPDDVVNGTEIGTCLGDTFSVAWMEDTDAQVITKETLDKQFKDILVVVDQSHPLQFGNLSWTNEVVSDYLGAKVEKRIFRSMNPFAYVKSQVDSRNVKLEYLKKRANKLLTENSMSELIKEQRLTNLFDDTFKNIDHFLLHKTTGSIRDQPVKLPEDLTCLRTAVKSFEKHCTKFSDYGLKYVKNLAHLCYTHNLGAADFNDLFTNLCASHDL